MQITPDIVCQICQVEELNPLGYLSVKEQKHVAEHLDMFSTVTDIRLLTELLPNLEEEDIQLLSTGICQDCRENLH